MFEMFQTIWTTVPVPALGLGAGAKGVIVDVYHEPYPGYEIEFIDAESEPIGLLSMQPNEISSTLPARLAA
jgi:hypothetical protein